MRECVHACMCVPGVHTVYVCTSVHTHQWLLYIALLEHRANHRFEQNCEAVWTLHQQSGPGQPRLPGPEWVQAAPGGADRPGSEIRTGDALGQLERLRSLEV